MNDLTIQPREFEKVSNPCTFTPAINNYQQEKSRAGGLTNTSGTEGVHSRLILAGEVYKSRKQQRREEILKKRT